MSLWDFRLASPLQTAFFKNVVMKIHSLKMDDVDFVVLATFLFWSTGGFLERRISADAEGVGKATEALAKKIRTKVTDECLAHFELTLPRKEAALRFVSLILLIPAIEVDASRHV